MTELKVYTTEEALEVLKVTQRTLYRYIKAGQIKAVKLGREYRITEDALKDFLERGTESNYLDKIQKTEGA
jgi:excisionase family DNA binding protein